MRTSNDSASAVITLSCRPDCTPDFRVRAVENETDLSEEELEQQMQDFMRSQADRESGKYKQLYNSCVASSTGLNFL